MVEQQIVDLRDEGSNPFLPPMMTKGEFIYEYERAHGHSGFTRAGADPYSHLYPSYSEEDLERAWNDYSLKAKACEESYLAYIKKKREYFVKKYRR